MCHRCLMMEKTRAAAAGDEARREQLRKAGLSSSLPTKQAALSSAGLLPTSEEREEQLRSMGIVEGSEQLDIFRR